LPNLNPIVAPDAYCETCGKLLEKTVDLGPGKRVSGIWYSCTNSEKGCDYRVYSDARLTGQTTPNPKKA